jgi:phage shock protein A
MERRIWSKVKRILRGRIIDGLERIESPEQSLRLSIDEIDDAYQRAKAAAANYAMMLKRLEKEREQCRRLSAEWEHRATQAVRQEDEPTARLALAANARLEDRLTRLAPRIEEARGTYKRLRDDLTRLRERLDDARLRQAELRGRRRAADAQLRFARNLDRGFEGSGDNEAFYNMEESVLTAEAESEIERAISEEDRGDDDDCMLKLRVDAALADAKRRLAQEE